MSDERETLEIDVLFVGAGPASLAGAYHLARLIARAQRAAAAAKLEVSIAVLEKGKEVGSHALSGAVRRPARPRASSSPTTGARRPFEGEVERRAAPLPHREAARCSLPIPPPLENHGNYVASLGKLRQVDGAEGRGAGVDVFSEFPAAEALVEDGRVVGVRTGDKGVGQRRPAEGQLRAGRRHPRPGRRCSARARAARWPSSSTSQLGLCRGQQPAGLRHRREGDLGAAAGPRRARAR